MLKNGKQEWMHYHVKRPQTKFQRQTQSKTDQSYEK